MNWTNILVPLLGGDADRRALDVARSLAAPFEATITAAYASTPSSELIAWVNEAGVSTTAFAVSELQKVSLAGEASARDALADLEYPHKAFENVTTEDWQGVRLASRLADVVVWSRAAARGHSYFSHAFQQILLEEQRPALIADQPPPAEAVTAIAWDGGREASRAVRRAVPLLRRSRHVSVLTVPHALRQPCEPARLLSYLADQGVEAEPVTLYARGDPGPLILSAAHRIGATVLVAGAFGHPRLQRFIFGGVTQTLLEETSDLALFISH